MTNVILTVLVQIRYLPVYSNCLKRSYYVALKTILVKHPIDYKVGSEKGLVV